MHGLIELIAQAFLRVHGLLAEVIDGLDLRIRPRKKARRVELSQRAEALHPIAKAHLAAIQLLALDDVLCRESPVTHEPRLLPLADGDGRRAAVVADSHAANWARAVLDAVEHAADAGGGACRLIIEGGGILDCVGFMSIPFFPPVLAWRLFWGMGLRPHFLSLLEDACIEMERAIRVHIRFPISVLDTLQKV